MLPLFDEEGNHLVRFLIHKVSAFTRRYGK